MLLFFPFSGAGIRAWSTPEVPAKSRNLLNVNLQPSEKETEGRETTGQLGRNTMERPHKANERLAHRKCTITSDILVQPIAK